MSCPTCGAPIDLKKHRGLVINRRAAAGSRCVQLRERLSHVRDPKQGEALARELAEAETEYNSLQEMEALL